MEIRLFKVGRFKTNCYILFDSKHKKALIVDPGGNIDNFENIISDYSVEYILITHGHFDHILCAKKYKDITKAKIVISEADKEFLEKDELNLSKRFLKNGFLEKFSADILVNDGDVLPFSEEFIEVISTPGHTIGSVCYKIRNVIFSGDTIFCGTYGHTGFPTGSESLMKKSLKKLYSLNVDFKIYPGHSKSTLLSVERAKTTGF